MAHLLCGLTRTYGHRMMRSEDHKHTSASLRLSFKVGGDQEAEWLPKSRLD